MRSSCGLDPAGLDDALEHGGGPLAAQHQEVLVDLPPPRHAATFGSLSEVERFFAREAEA